ncbi:MAG: hypothetical protein ABI844_11070 [Saprospiraceae bacterium]
MAKKNKQKSIVSKQSISKANYNILILNAENHTDEAINEIINDIKLKLKKLGAIYVLSKNDHSGLLKSYTKLPDSILENDLKSNNLILIDASENSEWSEQIEQFDNIDFSITDKPRQITLVDNLGSTRQIKSNLILPFHYLENLITFGEIKQNAADLLHHHALLKESITIESEDKIYPENNLFKKISKFPQTLFIQPFLNWKKNKDRLSLYQFILNLVLAGSLMYALIGALNVGISSDENRYIGQAEKVFNFYKTFGKDSSALQKTGVDPQYFNGQIFDDALYTFGKPFGLDHNFTFRHLIIAITGWFSILFAALIALRLMGYRAALFTTILILLSPIYMGNVFNNHRDIPLATFTVFGVYAIIRFWDYFPFVNRKYLLYIVLALMLSLSSRLAGGVLLIALMGLYSLLKTIQQGFLKKVFSFDKSIRKPVLSLLIGAAVAYIITILLWPYGLTGPFKHAAEVIKSSGNHPVALFQIFESKYRLSSSMPDYYVLKYIGITVPIAVLMGLILVLFGIFSDKPKLMTPELFILLFAFSFPLIYSYFELGNMYGSWRHFMFTFPFIAISSGIGWHALFSKISKFNNTLWPIGILVLTLIHPLVYVIKNHPFEYLYYNELVGGTKGAYGNYEWDYSLNSLKQGSDWLKKYIRDHHPKGTKLVIASNGGAETAEYFEGFDDSISTIYTRYYERGNQLWDYALYPNMYIHPYQLKNHIFSSRDSLHYIKIDGEPVCFILKRNNTDDYAAGQAMASNDANTALQKFQSYIKYNPKSEWAWFQMGYIYAQYNNWAQAQTYINECFKYHPEFLPGRALQSLIYLNTNRPKDAQPILLKLIEDKYDLGNSYKWSGQSYESEKNYRKALEQYGFALGAGNTQKDTYAKIANCFRQLGDMNQAAKYEGMSK